jgi:hypothetical protein
LRSVRRVALIVLGLQLAGLLAWSNVLASRHALTWDLAAYNQAWYLIAHGNLNPFNTLLGFHFWRNDAELIMWPLALLFWVWPHAVTLLWIQDLAIVGSELVVLLWLGELLSSRTTPHPVRPDLILGFALAVMVVNPWIYWTASFDFHFEPIYALFLLLTARALSRGQRTQTFVWAACTLLCGVPAALYLAGLAIGGLMMTRSRRVIAGAVLVGSLIWVFVVSALGGSVGGAIAGPLYAQLTGRHVAGPVRMSRLALAMLEHPIRLAQAWWPQRVDAFAIIAPSGGIGIVYGWAVGVVTFCLGVADLPTNGKGNSPFAGVAFQQFPAVLFTLVGTVMVLCWMGRRVSRRLAVAIAGLILAQAVAWAVVWLPVMPGTWLRVSPRASATLAKAQHVIPAQAEVVVSQGVAGLFSSRASIYAILGLPARVPVHTDPLYFVIAPGQGIEVAPVAAQEALLTQLASSLGAKLVLSGGGVWVFRWDPPPGATSVALSDNGPTEGAWGMASTTGIVVTTGPVDQWHVSATSTQPGYVEHGGYWREGIGSYEARVSLSTSGLVNVEVWNATGDVLLARRQLPATNGLSQVAIRFQVMRLYRPYLYRGWGPFRLDRPPPPAGNDVEVRVWSPGGLLVSVYSIGMTRR